MAGRSRRPALEWLHEAAGRFKRARDGSGRLFIVEQEGRIRIVKAGLGDVSFLLTSFGEDEAGNLFVTDYSNGQVYEIVPAAG